jgi:methyl-accepting chemotaxis protein
MTLSVEQSRAAAREIAERAREVRSAQAGFGPMFDEIASGVEAAAAHTHEAHDRAEALISRSESMVQAVVSLGGATSDSALIALVRASAAKIGTLFAQAIEAGTIAEAALFDTRYRPIPGSDPQQVMAAFTRFTDNVLPAIQEPVLDLDPRVVFCAAVDRNGYLPTHNNKFSHPQGDDPVWNAANCRNRRIFSDRVGRSAGASVADFLLQIYRRDMGGGQFALMKDLSAPIIVNGRHWGGLRLGFRF